MSDNSNNNSSRSSSSASSYAAVEDVGDALLGNLHGGGGGAPGLRPRVPRARRGAFGSRGGATEAFRIKKKTKSSGAATATGSGSASGSASVSRADAVHSPVPSDSPGYDMDDISSPELVAGRRVSSKSTLSDSGSTGSSSFSSLGPQQQQPKKNAENLANTPGRGDRNQRHYCRADQQRQPPQQQPRQRTLFPRSNSISFLPPKPVRHGRTFNSGSSNMIRDSSTSSSTSITEDFPFDPFSPFESEPNQNAGGDTRVEREGFDDVDDGSVATGPPSLQRRSFLRRWNSMPVEHQSSAEDTGEGPSSTMTRSATTDSSSFRSSGASSSSHQRIQQSSMHHGSFSSLRSLHSESSCSTAADQDQRERKKIRARRNSVQGTVAPLSESSPSFTHLVQSSASDWKRVETGSPSNMKTGSNEFSFSQELSPARSVASSRKRGVGGSPLFLSESDGNFSSSTTPGGMSVSDNAGSTTGPRQMRSRSRVFSPESRKQISELASSLPFAFPPPVPFGAHEMRTRKNSLEDGRGVMDIDSSSDEDGDDNSTHDSSRDTSLESSMSEDHAASSGLIEKAEHTFVENEQDVLDSMPSYPDLKFLIHVLRKERKQGSRPLFGSYNTGGSGGASWTVTPKVSWESTRRSGFCQWATQRLGFTVRAAGGSVHFLQISKTKGSVLLSKLEAALVMYKQQQKIHSAEKIKTARDATQHAPAPASSFSLLDTIMSSLSARKAPPAKDSRYVQYLQEQ